MRKVLLTALAAAALAGGCVKVDDSLGENLIDKSLLMDTFTETYPLTGIRLKLSSDLSGFSDTKVTVGAIRDDVFGLTTRESAFPLIPAADTIDLGQNPVALGMDISFAADTISCADDSQVRILQNLLVTELSAPLDMNRRSTNTALAHSDAIVTDGIPVYSGEGALNFRFTKAFAQKYVDGIVALGPVLKDRKNGKTDKYKEYCEALPGIHIRTEAPQGNGGRINMFNLSCLSVSNSYYVRNDNVAILKVRSTWNGVQKDSSFLFIPGEPSFIDESDYINNNKRFYQYAFNSTGHSTAEGAPTDRLLVEGGGGVKPVVSAQELLDHAKDAIEKHGGDISKAIIVKASLIFPYEQPDDWTQVKYFPTVLSPTIRSSSEKDGVTQYTFAGLTDTSVSSENQGTLDRALLQYAPDITYHMQAILRHSPEKLSEADVWLLTLHTNKVANANGSLYDNEYYRNLMYASYYDSLYGGGYGGYGYGGYGYGGYGGYSNYYNYMMMAQMMSASSQTSYSYTTELDKDRYYKGILCGMSSQRAPQLRISFAIPRE